MSLVLLLSSLSKMIIYIKMLWLLMWKVKTPPLQ